MTKKQTNKSVETKSNTKEDVTLTPKVSEEVVTDSSEVSTKMQRNGGLERKPLNIGEGGLKLERASALKEKVYERPDSLAIDKNVTEYFTSMGYGLRWVRTSIEGSDDHKNMNKRLQEGWEVVATRYLEDEDLAMYSSDKETIAVGDLTLFMCPLINIEARQKFHQKRNDLVNQRVDAALRGANNISDSQLSSQVSGANPAFRGSK